MRSEDDDESGESLISELEEVEVAKRGVVFIDEFDKLAIRGQATGERNQILQRRLLQFVDGTAVSLKLDHGAEEVLFDTGGVLFIAAGAFVEILEKTGERSHGAMRGLQNHDHVIAEDIVRYGFMKELVARLPVLIEFAALNTDELLEILNTPSVDPSKFYADYLESLGTTLEITDGAKLSIAKAAVQHEIGARGLHQVLFPILAAVSQEVEKTRPESITLDVGMIKAINSKLEEQRHARRTSQ